MTTDSTTRPVLKDRDRFKRFSPDRRAILPPDSGEPVPFVPTTVLIAERERALLRAGAHCPTP